jgi:hypothetical protein
MSPWTTRPQGKLFSQHGRIDGDPDRGVQAMTMSDETVEPAVEVFLVVESRLPAEEISKRLTTEPTSSRRFRHPFRGEELTEWSVKLTARDQAINVIEESGQILATKGGQWLSEVTEIGRGGGSSISLVIVQRVSDDPHTKGIFLSNDLVKWLGVAGASVSIDQYYGLSPAGDSENA